MTKRVRLYIGAPGSGKTTAAFIECDYFIDDAEDETEFDLRDIVLPDGALIGITVPYLIADMDAIVQIFAKYDTEIADIVIFQGDEETLNHNARRRGDYETKRVGGYIRSWVRQKYSEKMTEKFSEDFTVSVRKVPKY